mgnify:CR=1 FL=1
MALREISGNVQTDNCENIAELKKYRRGLAKNLKEVELRIQQRLGRLSGDASFSSDNTVNEVSLLEEDKFVYSWVVVMVLVYNVSSDMEVNVKE